MAVSICLLSITFTYFFHPYSTEMSEWGWIAVLYAWLAALSKNSASEEML